MKNTRICYVQSFEFCTFIKLKNEISCNTVKLPPMKGHQTPHKVFARSAENHHARTKDFPSKKSNKAHDS